MGLALVLVPTISMACIEGTYFEKNVGDFKVTMFYDAYKIKPGQTVRFHFDLTNVSSDSYGPGNPIDYDTAEAYLRRGDTLVFDHAMSRVDFSETAFNYVMPKTNADYVMDVRFLKDGHEMAATSIPFRAGWGSIWRNIRTMGKADSALLEGVTVEQRK